MGKQSDKSSKKQSDPLSTANKRKNEDIVQGFFGSTVIPRYLKLIYICFRFMI